MPELTEAKYKKAIYSDTYDNKDQSTVSAQKKIQPSTFGMFASIWFSTIIHLTRLLFIHFKNEDNGLKCLITKAD